MQSYPSPGTKSLRETSPLLQLRYIHMAIPLISPRHWSGHIWLRQQTCMNSAHGHTT